VFVHALDHAEAALAQARRIEPGGAVLGMRPLEIPLRVGDQIKLTLESDAVVPNDSVQNGSWNGRWVCFYFMLRLPDVQAEKIVLSRLRVFVNGMPAGLVLFKMKVMPSAPDLLPSLVPQDSRAWKRFFVSYAAEDRVEVLKAVQVMNALKVDYFQDLLTLSPGDRWQRRLFVEIEKCDVFLLFWSRYARQSEWVIREAEHALTCSRAVAGRPYEIVPVLLEGPPPPPPPEALREIHFNDPIRYVIFAAESTTEGPRPPSPPLPGPEHLEICIGRFTRALEVGTTIEPQWLGSAAAMFDPAPIAETIRGPAGSDGLGLRNLSSIPWQAKLPNGIVIDVAPGRAVRLGPGLVIKFGDMEIEGVVRSTNGPGG
jgi:TIR domain-containing protein